MTHAQRWKEIVAAPEEEIDLPEAALVLAAFEYPELDIEGYRARLNDLGAALRRRLRGDISPTETLIALNRYFFDELGFAGNAADFYDPRNSYLNEVLDRRLGIPITLALVYVEIGRRAGLALHGVAFPGHFLVKCILRDGAVVLDPCARGVSLSLEQLQARLRTLGSVAPTAEMVGQLLAAAGKKTILARMLRNLKGIYRERGDLVRALGAADRIVSLEPSAADEYRERAAIHLDLECFRAALADYRHYLMLKPGAEDAAVVRRQVVELEQVASRLN